MNDHYTPIYHTIEHRNRVQGVDTWTETYEEATHYDKWSISFWWYENVTVWVGRGGRLQKPAGNWVLA